jgi:hypothetical protein
MAEENAVTVFTNQLMYWQREGFYVLLNSFFNMKEKNIGFVVSVNEAEQKFIYKLYVNRELNEKHYPFAQVNEMIAEIDQVIKS